MPGRRTRSNSKKQESERMNKAQNQGTETEQDDALLDNDGVTAETSTGTNGGAQTPNPSTSTTDDDKKNEEIEKEEDIENPGTSTENVLPRQGDDKTVQTDATANDDVDEQPAILGTEESKTIRVEKKTVGESVHLRKAKPAETSYVEQLQQLLHFLKKHLAVTMTVITIGGVSSMVTAAFTFWMIGEINRELVIRETITRLEEHNRLLPPQPYCKPAGNETLKFTSETNSSTSEASSSTSETSRSTDDRSTGSNQGLTYPRIEYLCLVEHEVFWKKMESDLENSTAKLRTETSKELHRQAFNISNSYRNHTQYKIRRFNRKINSNAIRYASLSKTVEDLTQSLESLKREHKNVAGHQAETDKNLEEQPEVLEMGGFMKIETFGPILMFLGTLEMVMLLCVLGLCTRSMPSRSQNAVQANNQVVQPRRSNQPATRIVTSNDNVCYLSFRNADEEYSKRIGDSLLRQCQKRLNKRVHVVNSVEDVEGIPACRAALVFVDPDEREMIIEDPRYHIGQGLRRLAVQRLMDSGVEIFIIIKDKNSANLPVGRMYNGQLGQINEHQQLKRLKGDNRIFSIQNDLRDYQKEHLVREFNRIYL